MKHAKAKPLTILVLVLLFLCRSSSAQAPRFKVLVLTEPGGLHEGFVVAALDWLTQQAAKQHFEFRVIHQAAEIDESVLSRHQLLIQLNYPPYKWSDSAQAAFVKYLEEGKGGWVGFHHASLLGEFDGYPMWDWFSAFLGGIRFKNYIAVTASGKVSVEDRRHPVMNGVPPSFTISGEEWYTFDKNPRPNIHVLATVDESSYQPASEIKMGDHPVVWTNPRMKARNVYFLMGHHAGLFRNDAFTIMVANAILWAAQGAR